MEEVRLVAFVGQEYNAFEIRHENRFHDFPARSEQKRSDREETMHLTKGRPKELSGRAAREIRVYDLLDELKKKKKRSKKCIL